MSRIGRAPITVPAGVTVTLGEENRITVKGPKGELSYNIPASIKANVEGSVVHVTRPDDEAENRALHGLVRSLINNMIIGVSVGYEKKREIVGVGYRAEKKGNALQLNVGYSHPVIFEEPAGIKIDVPNQNTVIVNGIDKVKVGEIAAKIRSFRTPNPYADSAALAKGIRYQGERIAVKEGKKSSK